MLWGKSSARRMAEEVVVATGIGGDLCVREKGLLDQASGPELWGRGGPACDWRWVGAGRPARGACALRWQQRGSSEVGTCGESLGLGLAGGRASAVWRGAGGRVEGHGRLRGLRCLARSQARRVGETNPTQGGHRAGLWLVPGDSGPDREGVGAGQSQHSGISASRPFRRDGAYPQGALQEP